MIKRLLEDNKKAWNSKLKFALWVDRVTTKRSIGISPFQLVYGAKFVFPSQLAIPVEKFLQDYQEEPNDMVRRIHQLVEVQQAREQVMIKIQHHQQAIKQFFDKKAKKEEF
jgi:DNA-binding transcriptional regulator PaaX